jgi:hypothetical protein
MTVANHSARDAHLDIQTEYYLAEESTTTFVADRSTWRNKSCRYSGGACDMSKPTSIVVAIQTNEIYDLRVFLTSIQNRFYSVEVSQALVARLTRVRFTVGPHHLLLFAPHTPSTMYLKPPKAHLRPIGMIPLEHASRSLPEKDPIEIYANW